MKELFQLLGEISAIPPEKAVTQTPSLRCREFSVAMAEWLVTFAQLCEEKVAQYDRETDRIFGRSEGEGEG